MKKHTILLFGLILMIQATLSGQIVCNANFCYNAILDANNRICITTENLSTSNDSIVAYSWTAAEAFTSASYEITNICWPAAYDSVGVQLTISTQNGCTSSTEFVFVTPGSSCNPQVQIPENSKENNISIYYSPSDKRIIVNSPDQKNDFSIVLYDMMGRSVISGQAMQTQNTIDCSSLPNGIYCFKASDQNKVFKTGKIIIF